MIKSVVREYHFSPATVGDFYLDEIDFNGLRFWYDDVLEIHEAMKKKTPKK
jgi:hypothetical protein